ncbi:hypothetical protein EVAR_92798_1 [Eumeta japonica]|uniref:Uncharacterized protein n=1 Tax=Eumeta variegata TaxID=151549 RepID=A0A4C2A4P5_EUMVA|nr:hypothetical protein EVAR_92798_1 [Eumeta japonica]
MRTPRKWLPKPRWREGFVPVLGHGRRPRRGARGGTASTRTHKPAPHAEQPSQSQDQPQQPTDAPKNFVEAPIPKVNPWQFKDTEVVRSLNHWVTAADIRLAQ